LLTSSCVRRALRPSRTASGRKRKAVLAGLGHDTGLCCIELRGAFEARARFVTPALQFLYESEVEPEPIAPGPALEREGEPRLGLGDLAALAGKGGGAAAPAPPVPAA